MWDDNSGEYTPSLNYQLYKLRFPQMANGVINDLCKRFTFYYDEEPFLEKDVNTEYLGFDRLLIRSVDIRQEVLAGKGGIVIHVRYYGENGIDDVIHAVSEHLNRW